MSTPPARLLWGVPMVLLLAAAFGATATTGGLPEASGAVRWGLLVVRFGHVVVAALTAGTLLIAFLSRPVDRGLLRRGAELALAWLALMPVLGLLELTDISGGEPVDPGRFLLDTLVGRAWLAELVCVAAVVALAATARGVRTAGAALAAALAGVAVPAAVGHGGLSGAHVAATVSLGLHLAGVALWVGGLATLCAVLSRRPQRATVLVPAFSGAALICALIVGESGLANASLRLPTPGMLLTTSYGSLVLAKALLFGVLVALGWRQRRRAIPRIAGGRGPALLLRVAGLELLIMAAALAVSVVLVRLGPTAVIPAGGGVAPLAAVVLVLAPGLLVAHRRPGGRVADTVRRWPEVVAVAAVVVLAEVTVVALPQHVLGADGGAVASGVLLVAAGWALAIALGTRRPAVTGLLLVGTAAVQVWAWGTGAPAGPSLVATAAMGGALAVWWRWPPAGVDGGARRPSDRTTEPQAVVR